MKFLRVEGADPENQPTLCRLGALRSWRLKDGDVITTSLKSHVSHLIHLITLFEAIPIDCYLDQVSILYGC